jgi:pSer/pThr/pTyr-binding forkhead associated (FHA) protein
VRPVDGALELTDLGSVNGTYVNGERIHEPTRLADGDLVAFGRNTLAVEIADRPASDPKHAETVTASGVPRPTMLGSSEPGSEGDDRG